MLEALKAARIIRDYIKREEISVTALLDIMGIRGSEIPLDKFARLLDHLGLKGINKLHLTELYASIRGRNKLHVQVEDFSGYLGIE